MQNCDGKPRLLPAPERLACVVPELFSAAIDDSKAIIELVRHQVAGADPAVGLDAVADEMGLGMFLQKEKWE